jgi:hypothetical protein
MRRVLMGRTSGRVAAEFVIVVMGVLVALAADSAMDRLGEKESARTALQALHHDLSEDLAVLDTFRIPRLEERQRAWTRLASFLESSDPIEDSLQFIGDVQISATYFTFDASTTAIEQLRSTNTLRLIEDEVLRDMLLAYYTMVEKDLPQLDAIHRAATLELAGRLVPDIIGGLAYLSVFEARWLEGDTEAARARAAQALDADAIRSGDALRRLLVGTAVPFRSKRIMYLRTRTDVHALVEYLQTHDPS